MSKKVNENLEEEKVEKVAKSKKQVLIQKKLLKRKKKKIKQQKCQMNKKNM